MKFREVSAKQVGGLTAAALLAGGAAKWKLESFRRRLYDEDSQAFEFLLHNPSFFRFFKKDVRVLAEFWKIHFAYLLLAAHDEEGFVHIMKNLNTNDRLKVFHYLDHQLQLGLYITEKKIQDSVEKSIIAVSQAGLTQPRAVAAVATRVGGMGESAPLGLTGEGLVLESTPFARRISRPSTARAAGELADSIPPETAEELVVENASLVQPQWSQRRAL